jgi:hypothetical protein
MRMRVMTDAKLVALARPEADRRMTMAEVTFGAADTRRLRLAVDNTSTRRRQASLPYDAREARREMLRRAVRDLSILAWDAEIAVEERDKILHAAQVAGDVRI